MSPQVFGIGASELEFQGPLALKGLLPEEFDSTDGLGGSLPGDLLFDLEVDAILPDLLGSDLIGGFFVMLAQLPQAIPVGLFSAMADGEQFEIIREGFKDGVR